MSIVEDAVQDSISNGLFASHLVSDVAGMTSVSQVVRSRYVRRTAAGWSVCCDLTGQLAVDCGGQLAADSTGQFEAENTGQFRRIFHLGSLHGCGYLLRIHSQTQRQLAWMDVTDERLAH